MSDRDEQTRSRAETVGRLLRGDAPDAKVAAADLLPILYDELRTLARARMAREMPGQTIQATALVHEAYLRLVGDEDPGWNGRGHFFGAAALAMRRILVEQARRKGRVKHGGDRQRQPLEDGCIAIEPEERDLLAVDDAVRRLETRDPRKGQIVNLRYFAGLTAEQTAHALGVSLGTVEREWRFIKAWLQEELAQTDPEASGGSGRV
ncbi:MAG: sigma-70 family RNA polymerase sigma factor [Phycisphaerales bacterium]|nr:sigma-70 family RNA polymerase sigma factor [Phycisphaerales bacterium]